MPFNPALPLNDSEVDAAELRSQFTGLQSLIDAIPAGPAGPAGAQGPPGPAFANVTVDSVTTVSPMTPAGAAVFFDGSLVHFSFTIPAGIDGATGPTGDVSSQQLVDAINTTSASSNGVALLLPVNPTPTALEVANKLDELIQALRR